MECGESGHMWLGCRAFFADKHILCDQTVRVTDRFGFFDAGVTPVALCGAGHRPSHKRHSQTMDCVFRKQTQIVGSFYGSMFDLPIRFASLAWLRARLREPPSASNEGFGQFESGFMCVGHL